MLRTITLITAAAAAAALSASVALAATTPFTASLSGRATEKVVGQTITATVAGKGTSTFGASTLSGTVKGTSADPPCSPLSGPGTLKTSKGTLKLDLVPTKSLACGDEVDRDFVTVSVQAKVLGGTGKFARAKGVLKVTGTYNRGSGLFKVKVKGTLTY